MIEQITLNSPLSARDSLAVLIMQPLIDGNLVLDEYCGWKLNEETKKKQLINLELVMDMASDPEKAGHNCARTDIVIIPEYSIPGNDGIKLIINKLTSSKVSNQIIIGGIDGQSKEEYLSLLSYSNLSKDTKEEIKESVKISSWVNSSIVIEKANDEIKLYVQPKMKPAFKEDNTMMCEGKTLLVYKTSPLDGRPPIYLFVPICFDWIARIGGTCVLDGYVDELKTTPSPNGTLWLIPVIQHNPEASHIDFLNHARERLTSGVWIDLFSNHGCIIMANTASRYNSNTFGQSSIIYPKQLNAIKSPLPIFISKSRLGLQACNDFRFRENGPVIHSFSFEPPTAMLFRPGDSRYVFRHSKLVCMDESYTDKCRKRWPSKPTSVCPYEKIYGDYIDYADAELTRIHKTYINFLSKLTGILKKVVVGNRDKKENDIISLMDMLCSWKSYNQNCDEWSDEMERVSLKTLAEVQCIIDLAFGNFDQMEYGHGKFEYNGINQLVVVDGGNKTTHNNLERNAFEKIGDIQPSQFCKRIIVVGETRDNGVYNKFGRLSGENEEGSLLGPPVKYIPLRKLVGFIDESPNEQTLKDLISKYFEEAI